MKPRELLRQVIQVVLLPRFVFTMTLAVFWIALCFRHQTPWWVSPIGAYLIGRYGPNVFR